MSELEKKKISKGEYLIKKEEIEMEFPDVSRMPRFLLAFYSYIGLPRFYQGNKGLGILYILGTLMIIPLFFFSLGSGDKGLLTLSGFLFFFMFLLLPLIETIIVFQDQRKDLVQREKLIKLREFFDTHEIDSSENKTDLDYEILHFDAKHEKRTVRMAGIIMLFLGLFGGHRFYLGDKKGGLLMLLPVLLSKFIFSFYQNGVGSVESFAIFGIIASLIYFVLLIVYVCDIFKLEKKVKDYNDRISLEKIDLIRKNSIVS